MNDLEIQKTNIEDALSLLDRPCPSPADFTTRRPPVSTPERWHWPRLPLRQPAHVHHWPVSLRQCRHPSTDQSGSAALRHHNCSGHNGWSLWAGYNRYVWQPSLKTGFSSLCYRNNWTGLSFGFCRFPGSKPCHGQLWIDSWRIQRAGDHTDNQQSQSDSSACLSVLFQRCSRKSSGDHPHHIRCGLLCIMQANQKQEY